MSQLDAGTSEEIKARHDCGVAWRHERRMKEVEDVGRGRRETLDRVSVECMNGGEEFTLAGTASAGIQEAGEDNLVVPILIYVGNSELGFPEKRVVRASKDLALLSDGTHHSL